MKMQICILLAFIAVFSKGLSKEGWKSRTIYQVLTDRFSSDKPVPECLEMTEYCGGNFRGLISNLSYIQELGFDAIWVSPITETTENGYHGYYPKDWFNINPHFGTKEDFAELIKECKKRDIKVMLDVVLNHAGPVGTDYKEINPFSHESDYHTTCEITENDWKQQNQWAIENCRIMGLPDLNHENSQVEEQLLSWVKSIISDYPVDGLRIDATPAVPLQFWKKLKNVVNGTFTVGDIPSLDSKYVARYLGALDSAFNYPLSDAIRDVFTSKKSFLYLKSRIEDAFSTYNEQLYTMATFFDNHNLPRFMNFTTSIDRIRIAIAFIMFFPGVPVFYYGDEQLFSGGESPENRELLWPRMDPTKGLYSWIKTLLEVRRKHKIWEHPYLELHASEHSLVFMRGTVVVALSNDPEKYQVLTKLKVPFKEGTMLREVFSRLNIRVGKDGTIELAIGINEARIYEVFYMEETEHMKTKEEFQ